MLNTLKYLFPSAVYENELTAAEREFFTIFHSHRFPGGFAVKTKELSERDRQLLSLSFDLQHKETHFQSGNPEWFAYFAEDSGRPDSLSQYPSFRLYYLEGRKLYDNQSDLGETVQLYFNEPIRSVFITRELLLVLVPEQSSDDSSLFDAGELAGILAADLLLDVFIYSGRRVHAEENVKEIFKQEKRLFELSRSLFPKERTFQGYEMLPFVLPLLEEKQQQALYHYALAGLGKESELVETLYHFFLCNLNRSLTAKVLHMHRNTLQYRLDKVFERTGIDMKQFPNASALYVLIRKLKR
ncbi:PucR family transcriptional regulator [Salibacterium halotolerans]|uniref:PucR C-terminal helix-turn-helix domain-containing protein n=1 Tax=Salibacterium halotolerans TaxID=1884432 RepID=A0A1I5T684_9BACI|nr:helix-turn-helix domain-containing protein [Salibacterium halotolerans]SFP78513.1 PucR C-terminal helix-turn-helix domain-containing protein [Salibacterium halotolerans]